MGEPNGLVRISYKQGLNEKDPTGFKEYRIPFDMVAEMVQTAGQYSAASFRDEYRHSEHAIPGSELIILDYDDGVKLVDAVDMFRQYIGIVATTRSHQKEKHGVVCDRFRVILPTLKPVKLEAVEFSKMMKEVIHNYGTDKACSDMSRMYYGYPEAEVFFLEGCQLFDWEPFYQSALDKDRQRQQQYKKPIQQPSGDREAAQMDKAIQTFMQRNFVPGARNPTLFRVAKWLRDERVDDVAGRVAALNNQSGCPLPDEEVSKIIRKL